MEKEKLQEELHTESEYLKKLHKIVEETLHEEELLVQTLTEENTEQLTPGQKLSDRVARFGGSWSFIISFLFLLMAWIIYNSTTSGSKSFDPYPFILMNLILSCIAALQAPIIMMSQNRQEEKDRKRSEKVDLLLEKELALLFKIQSQQMDLLNDICTRLDKKP